MFFLPCEMSCGCTARFCLYFLVRLLCRGSAVCSATRRCCIISVRIQSHGRQAEIDFSGAAFISLALIFVVRNTINVGMYVPEAFIQVTTVIRFLLSADIRDSISFFSIMLTTLLCSWLDD